MKKKILMVVLALTLAVSLLPSVTLAKTEVRAIEFNLNGVCYITESSTQWESEVDVNLEGNYRQKGDLIYLSPLTGTVTIGHETYSISVKPLNQSEPLWHSYWEFELSAGSLTEDYKTAFVEVNFKGSKGVGVGVLTWGGWSFSSSSVSDSSSSSDLSFKGVVDGRFVKFGVNGSPPTIE